MTRVRVPLGTSFLIYDVLIDKKYYFGRRKTILDASMGENLIILEEWTLVPELSPSKLLLTNHS